VKPDMNDTQRSSGNDRAPAAVAAGKWLNDVRAWWRRVRRRGRRAPKRLRLCESLALGERRFVAVVEFERARFLVGGTPSSLSLLARLDGNSADSRVDVKADGEDVP